MEAAAPLSQRHRPRWGTLLLVILLHVLAVIGLARAFAPELTAQAVENVVAVFNVTVTAPEDEPEAPPEPDEGAAAAAGKQAKPKEAAAPEQSIPVNPTPLPKASSTGNEVDSGARDAGDGTGAEGAGIGTGSGLAGGGQGSGCKPSPKPLKIAGDINSASDFPVPPGGRQIRFGSEVIVYMTVGTNGRASNCRVVQPSVDPVADRITCQLAVERFRFCPATNTRGEPVSATYGWRQWWEEKKK